MERKRYYRCLTGSATVYFFDHGVMAASPVNLCAEDTLEVTGEGDVTWDGDVALIHSERTLIDYVERVASLVEEYEFLIAREARRACMAYPLGA